MFREDGVYRNHYAKSIFQMLDSFFFYSFVKTVKTCSDLDPKDTFTLTLLFIGYDIILSAESFLKSEVIVISSEFWPDKQWPDRQL